MCSQNCVVPQVSNEVESFSARNKGEVYRAETGEGGRLCSKFDPTSDSLVLLHYV